MDDVCLIIIAVIIVMLLIIFIWKWSNKTEGGAATTGAIGVSKKENSTSFYKKWGLRYEGSVQKIGFNDITNVNGINKRAVLRTLYFDCKNKPIGHIAKTSGNLTADPFFKGIVREVCSVLFGNNVENTIINVKPNSVAATYIDKMKALKNIPKKAEYTLTIDETFENITNSCKKTEYSLYSKIEPRPILISCEWNEGLVGHLNKCLITDLINIFSTLLSEAIEIHITISFDNADKEFTARDINIKVKNIDFKDYYKIEKSGSNMKYKSTKYFSYNLCYDNISFRFGKDKNDVQQNDDKYNSLKAIYKYEILKDFCEIIENPNSNTSLKEDFSTSNLSGNTNLLNDVTIYKNCKYLGDISYKGSDLTRLIANVFNHKKALYEQISSKNTNNITMLELLKTFAASANENYTTIIFGNGTNLTKTSDSNPQPESPFKLTIGTTRSMLEFVTAIGNNNDGLIYGYNGNIITKDKGWGKNQNPDLILTATKFNGGITVEENINTLVRTVSHMLTNNLLKNFDQILDYLFNRSNFGNLEFNIQKCVFEQIENEIYDKTEYLNPNSILISLQLNEYCKNNGYIDVVKYELTKIYLNNSLIELIENYNDINIVYDIIDELILTKDENYIQNMFVNILNNINVQKPLNIQIRLLSSLQHVFKKCPIEICKIQDDNIFGTLLQLCETTDTYLLQNESCAKYGSLKYLCGVRLQNSNCLSSILTENFDKIIYDVNQDSGDLENALYKILLSCYDLNNQDICNIVLKLATYRHFKYRLDVIIKIPHAFMNLEPANEILKNIYKYDLIVFNEETCALMNMLLNLIANNNIYALLLYAKISFKFFDGMDDQLICYLDEKRLEQQPIIQQLLATRSTVETKLIEACGNVNFIPFILELLPYNKCVFNKILEILIRNNEIMKYILTCVMKNQDVNFKFNNLYDILRHVLSHVNDSSYISDILQFVIIENLNNPQFMDFIHGVISDNIFNNPNQQVTFGVIDWYVKLLLRYIPTLDESLHFSKYYSLSKLLIILYNNLPREDIKNYVDGICSPFKDIFNRAYADNERSFEQICDYDEYLI